MRQKPFIIVRGGGDLATGTIRRLWAAGFPVLVLETDHPAAIRRQVAVCEAVYEGSATVEGMEAVLIKDTAEAKKVIDTGKVPLIVDPDGALCSAEAEKTPGKQGKIHRSGRRAGRRREELSGTENKKGKQVGFCFPLNFTFLRRGAPFCRPVVVSFIAFEKRERQARKIRTSPFRSVLREAPVL